MTRFGAYLVLAAAVGFVYPAQALSLGDCTRVTHVSHGGQADHVDLGEGRVMWRNWWSQEGSSTDIVIADCEPGQVLMFRTAEENMNTRPALTGRMMQWVSSRAMKAGPAFLQHWSGLPVICKRRHGM